jgi:hypothetical protein
MPNNYFHLVPHIRAEGKYFDISLNEVERQLRHSNKFKFEGELVLDDDGEEATIPVSASTFLRRMAVPPGLLQLRCIASVPIASIGKRLIRA